jgi:hypothetical protein
LSRQIIPKASTPLVRILGQGSEYILDSRDENRAVEHASSPVRAENSASTRATPSYLHVDKLWAALRKACPVTTSPSKQRPSLILADYENILLAHAKFLCLPTVMALSSLASLAFCKLSRDLSDLSVTPEVLKKNHPAAGVLLWPRTGSGYAADANPVVHDSKGRGILKG